MNFLVSDWLWLFTSWYSPSSHKEDRSLLKSWTHHAWKQQKQQHQGIFKPEIGDHIMDHISFMWLIVFSFVTFKFTKIVSIYWFNLKYTYTLFISCTIKSVYEVGPNLFLVKFSNVHCWLVLNFLCCQGLGDQRNWESTCKVKSKVSWNEIWPAVITYTGNLILRDGAISHNWPQIASDCTICKKKLNSSKVNNEF